MNFIVYIKKKKVIFETEILMFEEILERYWREN